MVRWLRRKRLRLMLIWISVVCVLVGLGGKAWAGAGVGGEAVMTAVIRVVTHQKAGIERWFPSKKGQTLSANDRVRTAKRSAAEVQYADKSVVKMGELSELTILPPERAEKELRITQGSLWAKFVKGTTARIHTRTTVAAVRGTIVMVTILADGREVWRVFDGTLELLDPQTEEVRGRLESEQQTVVSTEGQVAPPTAAPPAQFAGTPTPQAIDAVEEKPFQEEVQTGEVTLVTNGTPQAEEFKKEEDNFRPHVNPVSISFDEGLVVVGTKEDIEEAKEKGVVPDKPQVTEPQLPKPKEGILDVEVRQWRRLARRLRNQRLSSRQAVAAMRVETGTFAFSREGHHLAGARLRPRGLVGNVYYGLGLTPVTLLDGDSTVRLTEAFLLIRSRRYGDIKVGRQWFVKGPIINTILGTLISNEISDAITWSPRLGEAQVDLAFMHDAQPFSRGKPMVGWFDEGKQQGWYGRLAVPMFGGRVASSMVRLHNVGTGYSFDFALPVIPSGLDFYGEVGRDAFFRDEFITTGLYFPELYQRTNTDLFLEYSKRPKPYREIYVLRLYRRIMPGLTSILILDHIQGSGDVNLGVGLALSFR